MDPMLRVLRSVQVPHREATKLTRSAVASGGRTPDADDWMRVNCARRATIAGPPEVLPSGPGALGHQANFVMSKRILPLNPDRQLQAYVIGLAIGDGNLSNPNGRAVRLRITCDAKYPALITKIVSALKLLLPRNRVSLVGSSGNYVNVSVYSNHLEALLGWKASGGSKHRQCVEVPAWICEDRSLSVPCLRGLIETGGAI
jgi:hypothetical protein